MKDTTSNQPKRNQLSEAGESFIKSWEGFKQYPYQDIGGVWTIGYGFTKGVTEHSKPISKEQADAMFKEAIKTYEDAVNRLVTVPLTQGQFDALVSFTWNLGIEAFENSTLRGLLNAGKYLEAAEQILRWVHVKGMKIRGLENRRKAEKELFNGLR